VKLFRHVSRNSEENQKILHSGESCGFTTIFVMLLSEELLTVAHPRKPPYLLDTPP
jgi:hypothetical protein